MASMLELRTMTIILDIHRMGDLGKEGIISVVDDNNSLKEKYFILQDAYVNKTCPSTSNC